MIHVYHHVAPGSPPGSDTILTRLSELETRMLTRLAQGESRIMAEVTTQMQAVLTAIDTETDALAGRIEAEFAKFAENMDQAEADPLLKFGADLATKLRGMAKSAENPVPDPTAPIEV